MVTYPPKAILKNPKLKQAAWEDFKKIRNNYLN
jgi:uracil-DNA glycosylase